MAVVPLLLVVFPAKYILLVINFPSTVSENVILVPVPPLGSGYSTAVIWYDIELLSYIKLSTISVVLKSPENQAYTVEVL